MFGPPRWEVLLGSGSVQVGSRGNQEFSASFQVSSSSSSSPAPGQTSSLIRTFDLDLLGAQVWPGSPLTHVFFLFSTETHKSADGSGSGSDPSLMRGFTFLGNLLFLFSKTVRRNQSCSGSGSGSVLSSSRIQVWTDLIWISSRLYPGLIQVSILGL